MPGNYGDILAQKIDKRLYFPVANEAALASVPSNELAHGRMFLAISEQTLWEYSTTTSSFLRIGATSMVRYVRGVATGSVSLTAFPGVTGGTPNDGITYIAGDRILLPVQGTAAQCGIYVVGTVSAGTAPLTRAPDMPAGAVLPLGTIIEVGPEGTLYKNSTWKATATTTGGPVIGTNDPVFYPRKCGGTATLSSGVYALGSSEGLWLLATGNPVQVTLNTPNTVTATIDYRAPVASRTAGKVGTAAVTLAATKTDGTTDTANGSTVDWLVTLW
jgi:hypothetical protein